MTHPDDDTLAAIALGDPAPSGAAEHAHSCPQCSRALASLRDTVTTLHAPAPELVAPPQSVWHAVESELDREADAVATAPASVATLPAAHPVAAQATTAPPPDAGDELTRRRSSRATRRRFPVAWVAGAAAAGLVVGVVGARALGTAAGRPGDHRRLDQPGHARHPAGARQRRCREAGRAARPRR